MKTLIQSKNLQQGYLLVLVLVYSAVLFTIISSFVGFIVTQSRVIEQKVNFEQAGQIAEAGLNYYKWFLAHYPNDVTNGTGLPGPYIGVYKDPEGGPIGEYSLSIASTTYCGDVASIEVTSTGYTYKQPDVKRTISGHYSRPTVAEYAFIINSNVWAGEDRVITGPYHSNGGIRMDGENRSVVTSQQSTWTCTGSFGCNPDQSRDGVFTSTSNANSSLFAFPSAPINFAGITVDLSTIQNRAQYGGGLYIPPSGDEGYRVIFNSNGTVTIRRVNSTILYWGYTTEDGWQQERNIFNSNSFVGTYTIPTSCPVIFVEDKVWLEGTVKDKVTLAVADLDSPGVSRSIILKDNITYVSATSSGLLAMAEDDVLIGVDVPDTMYINGIYIAQTGRYGRNFYCNSTWYCPSAQRLPVAYRPYAFRNSEIMNGTIVSNGRVGTQWTSGGNTTSGFYNRFNSYDRNLVLNPPPFAPVTSDVYRFTNWQDQN